MNRRKKPLSMLLTAAGLALVVAGGLSCMSVKLTKGSPLDTSVGLDIDIINGQLSDFLLYSGKPLGTTSADGKSVAPYTLAPNRDFHINQLRFSVQLTGYPAADVFTWLTKQTEFSVLDWTGAEPTWEEAGATARSNPVTYEKNFGIQHAAWMDKKPSFTLNFCAEVDPQTDQCKSGTSAPGFPIIFGPESFVMTRQVAIYRANGMQTAGDVGNGVQGPKGTGYSYIQAQSGGTFAGKRDEIYIIKVAKPGKLDGTAMVTVSSVTGRDNVLDTGGTNPTALKQLPVTSGVPIALGSNGATITFNDDAAPGTETLGAPACGGAPTAWCDRWIVRCTATDKSVKQVEPSTRADWQASAEIRLTTAAKDAPIFRLPAENAKYLRVTWSYQTDAAVVYPKKTAAPGTVLAPNVQVLGSDPKYFGYGMKASFRFFGECQPGSQSCPATPDPWAGWKDNSLFKPGDKVRVTVNLTDENDRTLLVDCNGKDGKDKDPTKWVDVKSTCDASHIETCCLPSYEAFKKKGDGAGQDPAAPGLLYQASPTIPGGEGFFNENRVNVQSIYLVGPKQDIKQVWPGETADYVSISQTIGLASSVTGAGNANKDCQANPTGPTCPWLIVARPDWTFTLPATAKPGTYIVMFKIARQYLGQRLYRIFQTSVGVVAPNDPTYSPTEYVQRVGNCTVCHVGEAGLDKLRHYSPDKDDFTCVVCHGDPPAVAITHIVHFQSPYWPVRKNDCTLCHLTQGSNIRAARGICGSCHSEEKAGHGRTDVAPYAECGGSCHSHEQSAHVALPPL
jgi:hypothetical protein